MSDDPHDDDESPIPDMSPQFGTADPDELQTVNETRPEISPRRTASDGGTLAEAEKWGECSVDGCPDPAKPTDSVCHVHDDPELRPSPPRPVESRVEESSVAAHARGGRVVEVCRRERVATLYDDGTVKTRTRSNDVCSVDHCDERIYGAVDGERFTRTLCREHFETYLILDDEPHDLRVVVPTAPITEGEFWSRFGDVGAV